MCCLRFEHETYRDLARKLPRRNTYVSTPDGAGKVVATDVVTQMVGVVLAGGRRINVPVESILERDLDASVVEESGGRRASGRGGRKGAPEETARGAERAAPTPEGVPSNKDKPGGEPDAAGEREQRPGDSLRSSPGVESSSAEAPADAKAMADKTAGKPGAAEGERKSRRRRGRRGRRRSRRKKRRPDGSGPQAPEGT
jgi:hypothetical protein